MLAHLLAPALARRGVHYGWAMAALTFLTSLSTAAVMGMPGVLMLPLHAEFGWDIADISAVMALRLMLFGLMGPFAAAIMLRYGVRATVVAAVTLVASALLLATGMTSELQLWATWGVMSGLGAGLVALVLGATVASRWFVARRGLVLGVIAAASATGQLAFLPLAQWLSDHYGWRVALLPVCAACVVAGTLMLLLGADYPGQLGLPAFGETKETLPPPRRGGAALAALRTLAEVSGNRVFWVLFGTFFICGLSTNGLVQVHLIPLCADFGIPGVQAAGLLAMMGVLDIFGTIGSGYLSDRFDSRKLLFWYYGLRGLSLVFLPFSNFTVAGLSVFTVFYGLDWIATVPPTVKLATQHFGRDRGPLVFGWIFTAHQLGAAVAAFGGGVARDMLGSYLPAFFVAGAACVLAALAAMSIRRPVAVAVAPVAA
jgi:sugar phosphate permease